MSLAVVQEANNHSSSQVLKAERARLQAELGKLNEAAGHAEIAAQSEIARLDAEAARMARDWAEAGGDAVARQHATEALERAVAASRAAQSAAATFMARRGPLERRVTEIGHELDAAALDTVAERIATAIADHEQAKQAMARTASAVEGGKGFILAHAAALQNQGHRIISIA